MLKRVCKLCTAVILLARAAHTLPMSCATENDTCALPSNCTASAVQLGYSLNDTSPPTMDVSKDHGLYITQFPVTCSLEALINSTIDANFPSNLSGTKHCWIYNIDCEVGIVAGPLDTTNAQQASANDPCGSPRLSTLFKRRPVEYRTLYFNTQNALQVGGSKQNSIREPLFNNNFPDFKLILEKGSDQTGAAAAGLCLYYIDNEFASYKKPFCYNEENLVLKKKYLRSLAVLYNDTSGKMYIMPKTFDSASAVNISTRIATITPIPTSQNNSFSVAGHGTNDAWCFQGSYDIHNPTKDENGTIIDDKELYLQTTISGSIDRLSSTRLVYHPSDDTNSAWELNLTRYNVGYDNDNTIQSLEYEWYFIGEDNEGFVSWPATTASPSSLTKNHLINLNVSQTSLYEAVGQLSFVVYKDNKPEILLLVEADTTNVAYFGQFELGEAMGTGLFAQTFGLFDNKDFTWNSTALAPAPNSTNTTSTAPPTTDHVNSSSPSTAATTPLPPKITTVSPSKAPKNNKKRNGVVLGILVALTTVAFFLFAGLVGKWKSNDQSMINNFKLPAYTAVPRQSHFGNDSRKQF